MAAAAVSACALLGCEQGADFTWLFSLRLIVQIAVIVAAVVGGVVGSDDDDNKGSKASGGQKNAAADADGDDGTEDGIGRDGAMVTMECVLFPS